MKLKKPKLRNPDKRGAFWLFMIGLFSMTQIRIGPKIGISEIFCCLVAPVLFFKSIPMLRRDGVLLYFNLLILWMFGALFADFYNKAAFIQLIRGFSVPVTIFVSSICIYVLLRKYPHNLKWILIGIAASQVLSTFVFQSGTAGDFAAEGDMARAIEAVVGYKLYWSNMAVTWFSLPVKCWYEAVPAIYTYPALIAVAVINAVVGGRSAFAVSALSIFLVLLGGKTDESIRKVKKKIPILLIGMCLIAVLAKLGYSYAAKHDYLSEEETRKYYKQTSKGSGFLSLLMAGRSEVFVGLIAALDKPIIGQGSQALDTYGYQYDFLAKYGTIEEIDRYARDQVRGSLSTIPAHSHVICYWMWHGIFGLIFWVYIFWLVIQTVRKRLGIIPEWYGYFAIIIPSFLWSYFFSPFGARVAESTLFCTFLILIRLENLRKRGVVWRG